MIFNGRYYIYIYCHLRYKNPHTPIFQTMKESKLQKKPWTQSLKNWLQQNLLSISVLILKLNNFIFKEIHYLQKLGCTMTTICTPNYSNIFMGRFERSSIYPCLQTFSNFFANLSRVVFYSGMDAKHNY